MKLSTAQYLAAIKISLCFVPVVLLFAVKEPPPSSRPENPRRPNPDVVVIPKPEKLEPIRPSAMPKSVPPPLWATETRDWSATVPHHHHRFNSGGALPLEAQITDSGSGSRTGSAVSIGEDGIWLTARHVTDGCDKVWIRIGHKHWLPAVRIIPNPRADFAVIETRSGLGGLPLVPDGYEEYAEGYHIGFPKGRPGVVETRYLGQMGIRNRGRHQFREVVNVWGVASHIPNKMERYGGLSGGATLNEDGQIVGIFQSYDIRRNRLNSALPSTLIQTIQQSNLAAEISGSVRIITAKNYPAEARRLIMSRRVAKVHCRVDGVQ